MNRYGAVLRGWVETINCCLEHDYTKLKVTIMLKRIIGIDWIELSSSVGRKEKDFVSNVTMGDSK